MVIGKQRMIGGKLVTLPAEVPGLPEILAEA
jgi:hypothetical protein